MTIWIWIELLKCVRPLPGRAENDFGMDPSFSKFSVALTKFVDRKETATSIKVRIQPNFHILSTCVFVVSFYQ
jgi:hypothetical protein